MSNLIFELIPRIMADVSAIEKTRKNQQQGYSFRGIDDVMSAFHAPLAKHGVFYIPEVLESEQTERATKTGGLLIYTRLKIAYTFYASDGSNVRAVVAGEAMDSADKSSNKAMSAALKYALLQIFCVPVEEQDDADYHAPQPLPKQTRNEQQTRQAVTKELDNAGINSDVRRAEVIREINKLCTLLTDANDKQQGKSLLWDAATLTKYILANFDTDGGIEALNFEQLQELSIKLQERLNKLTAKTKEVNA